MTQPRVSIVIVTWNKKEDVLRLLDSLVDLNYSNFQTVLVDNNSTDGTAEALAQHPLPFILLRNEKNLGGTGGFNTGLRHVLEHLKQDYIWLLDNDAAVRPDTLHYLVDAMEPHSDIGIAGSRIMAPEKDNLIVEVGGTIDWKHAIWEPNRRYQPHQEEDTGKVIDVDYVAACSALLRDSAFRRVGIMDERFFLHWDDIDLCLRFRSAGWRVVTVYSSVIFHSVEKGFNPNIIYFDLRNGLLMGEKHLSFGRRTVLQWAISRYFGLGWTAAFLDRRPSMAKIFTAALRDTLLSRYGGFSAPNKDKRQLLPAHEDASFSPKRILLFSSGPYRQVLDMLQKVRSSWPSAQIDLFVQRERKPLFLDNVEEDNIITFDLRRDGIMEKIKTCRQLWGKKYDLAVDCSYDFLFPYYYFLKKIFITTIGPAEFSLAPVNRKKIWHLPLLMTGGFLLAGLLWPVMVIKGVLGGK